MSTNPASTYLRGARIRNDGTVVPNEPEGTGYLLGMTSKNVEDYSFDTERGTEFTIEEPSFETDEGSGALLEGTEEQREYIKNYIQAVEDLIYSDGFTEKNSSAYDELGELMDLKAAADYWWIQELSLNGDAYNTPSTYLYKKADQTNEDGTVTKGKLYWGPLWDFDLAWDDDFFIRIFTSTHNAWFDRLRQNPEFAELLEVEWIKIKRLLDEASRDGGMIDQFKEEIADSYALDAKIWEGSEGYDIDLDKEPYAALKHMISSKRKICQDNIDDIGHVYADLTFVADGKVIDVLHPYFKELADEIAPDAPDKDDSVFEGWYTKDGTSYNDEIIADKDMTFYAKYIPEEEASKTQKILFPTKYMCTRTEEDGLCFIDYVLVPYDALDKRIEWTSSDENVLSPLNKGVFEYKGTGETVITAKIKGTGVSNSLTVYVYGEDEEVPEYKDLTMTKSLTISEGDSDQIIVTPTPERSDFFLNYMCTFSTDNDDIITVSDDGTVNALSPGTAEVTMEVSASAAMGDNDPVTRKCAVRVTGDLGSADVSGIKNLIYSGKAKAQSPIVKYDGNTLKKGTDYTLSYKNNVNVGTATVIITGKGCYTGTVKKTFRISPKGTKIKKLTKKRKAIKVRWKKQARKMKKSRITGYQIMVATNKAFTKNKKTVNVKGYKKTSKTIKKLKAKRKYYVRIRTFKKVNGTKYYSKWSKIRKIKTK